MVSLLTLIILLMCEMSLDFIHGISAAWPIVAGQVRDQGYTFTATDVQRLSSPFKIGCAEQKNIEGHNCSHCKSVRVLCRFSSMLQGGVNLGAVGKFRG
jgi:hypothetical protein